MITRLIDKGYAYAAAGDVYFDVSKDSDYGKLCNRDPEQLEAGSRIEVSDRKRNPGDFALWKGAKPGEPAETIWDAPWGKGRPGWHIECSVMSQALLGETLDIHGGGLDLQFPHHENELAQSESDTGMPFARVWMHNGLLKMGTAKMAGSVGNVVNIVDLLQRHSPETVRFLLLSTHYRSPIEYSEERLDEVKRSLDSFYRFFEKYEQLMNESFYTLPILNEDEIVYPGGRATFVRDNPKEQPSDPWENAFLRNMNDDFNTGGAIGVLFDTLRHANGATVALEKHLHGTELEVGMLKDILRHQARVIRTMSFILGLFSQPPEAKKLGGDDTLVAGLMQLLIDLRSNLRTEAKAAAKDNPLKKPLFDQTDLIRKRLADLGVTLEDRPTGTTWRVG
jgi:cysteinyl-tRNA synthetase